LRERNEHVTIRQEKSGLRSSKERGGDEMELFGFAIFLIVLALFVIEWRLKKLMQMGRESLQVQREISRVLKENHESRNPVVLEIEH
jgi:hypothetical protein